MSRWVVEIFSVQGTVPLLTWVGFCILPFPALQVSALETGTTPQYQALMQGVQQPSSRSQISASPVTTRVSFAGGRVSFMPPAGFTALTSEQIALKFPRGNPPQHVYGNQGQSVSVAVTFSKSQLSAAELPTLKKFMEPFLARITPGLKWIKRDFIVINKVRWVRLEFISRAIDTQIHNDAYFTSFNGKLLGFNFNSTLEKDNAVRPKLLESRNSILIR